MIETSDFAALAEDVVEVKELAGLAGADQEPLVLLGQAQNEHAVLEYLTYAAISADAINGIVAGLRAWRAALAGR